MVSAFPSLGLILSSLKQGDRFLLSPAGIKALIADPKGRAAVKRKRLAVQGKGIAETQRKIRQAQRVLGNSGPVSAKAFEVARDGESVSKKNAKVGACCAF